MITAWKVKQVLIFISSNNPNPRAALKSDLAAIFPAISSFCTFSYIAAFLFTSCPLGHSPIYFFDIF